MKSLLGKKIPTLIGLVVLLVGGAVGLVLIQQRSSLSTKASPETTPKQVEITNLSDTSFTVTWLTDAQTSGFVEFGSTTNPTNIASDERDLVTGEIGSFQIHHVTVRDLEPQTTYYFKINSGSSSFDNNGELYSVTTGAVLPPPEHSDVAYGLVHTSSGTPAEGALVIMETPNAVTLSTLVKSSGSWAIPLSVARTVNGNQYALNALETHPITLKIIAPNGQVTTGVTTTDNDQPVPTITLGQTFDFSQTNNSAGDDGEVNVSSQESTPSAEVELLNPSFEGERINTSVPEFQGRAPANTKLQIKVESPETFTGEVLTDENGEFVWSPPGDLEPGEHTITITYTDVGGILRQFTRSFFVFAQGESGLPSLTATPSGSTPTPTPRATATPTPIPTTTPTPRPTTAPTTSASPSGRTSLPATGSGIPVAGSTSTTIGVLLLGIGLIGTGVLLSRSLHLLDT